MVHVPTVASVTRLPDTVHTAVVVEAKLTASPEVAVALRVNGGAFQAWLDSGANAMVWLACVTWKLWLTGVAAR